ncbi:GPI ethanolamine phosphate transferase 3-like [Copidosoma floridanum]|uniref:GPI ethanolamine phosphate transferase 3-like n=1 Tax=Copidosoma floridanum TaxID=29053 RepID=UPI0006C97636|nr:GPI ethanolamine phosphate transferase 3-like [Copidosoma floridanum]
MERFHRALKAALMCWPQTPWPSALSLVLLGLRTAFKEDLQASPAEMLYGTTLRVPGEFFVTTSNPAAHPVSFVECLRELTKAIKTVPTTKSLGHVSPHRVISRRDDRTYIIDVGGRQVTISTNDLKPAHTDESLTDSPQGPQLPPTDSTPSISPDTSPSKQLKRSQQTQQHPPPQNNPANPAQHKGPLKKVLPESEVKTQDSQKNCIMTFIKYYYVLFWASFAMPQARVIILLVDALKYEFTIKYKHEDADGTFHRNKLPVISETLQRYPRSSKLFKFVADPPTTTMQRLKALTTGTLPTFIDINKNFAADTIEEDNIIAQNQENGNIVTGDCTWNKFYPGKFLRDHTVYSFDVFDLDTVDRSVRENVFNEMDNKDWTLLIGHMLGIDHCGHTYGMNHPEMLRKLNETNIFIKDVIEKINKNEEDTVLFIMGDHGMTKSGDHGGESSDETDAALFVYSTLPLISESTDLNIKSSSTVRQIGFVPTISVILGTPIPFSNIGGLIFEALPLKVSTENVNSFILHSLWRNIFQVQNYLSTYSSENFFSDKVQLDQIKHMYNELLEQVKLVKLDEDLKDFISLSNTYFSTVRYVCYKEWVQYNNNLMTGGLLIMFLSVLSLLTILSTGLVDEKIHLKLQSWFRTSLLVTIVIAIVPIIVLYCSRIVDLQSTLLFSYGSSSIIAFAVLLIENLDYIFNSWCRELMRIKNIDNLFLTFVLIPSTFGVFSNSYILEENKILSFFVITMFCFLIYFRQMIIYMVISSAAIVTFYWPISIFLLSKENTMKIRTEEVTIPKICEKLKKTFDIKKSEYETETSIVYGLETIYSSSFISLGMLLNLLYILLLGFLIAPSVIMMNIACIILLYVSAIDRVRNAANLEELVRVPIHVVLCWFLIAEYFFFATGHQATFSSIHWDAGFIGIDGSLSSVMFLRAVLIIINTYGSHIILGVLLPLLVITPFTMIFFFPQIAKLSKIALADIKQGEQSLLSNSYLFHSEIYSVCGKYILLHAFKVFACMIAVTVHKRHLMVWGIFAPKFIFTGISFFVTLGGILISILLILRIEHCLIKFFSKINDK